MNIRLIILFFCISLNALALSNDAVVSLIYDGIGIEVSDDPEEFQKIHGKPLSVEVQDIKNKYSDIPDTVYEYQYPNFVVYFYKFNHPEHGWIKLSEISITSDLQSINRGVKIGMSKDDIIKILDKPTNISNHNNSLYFHYSPALKFDNEHFPPEHEQLRLEFISDVLVTFSWLNWP